MPALPPCARSREPSQAVAATAAAGPSRPVRGDEAGPSRYHEISPGDEAAAARRALAGGGGPRALVAAARFGDLGAVESLLWAGVSPSVSVGEISPLRAALRHDHAPVVALLVARGARFRRRPNEPLGAISWALRHQASHSLPLLFGAAQAHEARRRPAGHRALMMASSPELARTLDSGCGRLPQDADRLVWQAARVGDDAAMRLALGAGASARRRWCCRWPGASAPPWYARSSPRPQLTACALHGAALAGRGQAVRSLAALDATFAANAMAFLEDPSGGLCQISALGCAVSMGHQDAAVALLEAGACRRRVLYIPGDGSWLDAAGLALLCGHPELHRLVATPRLNVARPIRCDSPLPRTGWCGLLAPRSRGRARPQG